MLIYAICLVVELKVAPSTLADRSIRRISILNPN
jgi:hypothetical protein